MKHRLIVDLSALSRAGFEAWAINGLPLKVRTRGRAKEKLNVNESTHATQAHAGWSLHISHA